MTDKEIVDRAVILMERSVNCGWITVHNEKQFLDNARIALDTEVRAGGPYLDLSDPFVKSIIMGNE
jgi:hypothetical protein